MSQLYVRHHGNAHCRELKYGSKASFMMYFSKYMFTSRSQYYFFGAKRIYITKRIRIVWSNWNMFYWGCDPHCLLCTTEGPGKCDSLQCLGDYLIVHGKQTCAGEERNLTDTSYISYMYTLRTCNAWIGNENAAKLLCKIALQISMKIEDFSFAKQNKYVHRLAKQLLQN